MCAEVVERVRVDGVGVARGQRLSNRGTLAAARTIDGKTGSVPWLRVLCVLRSECGDEYKIRWTIFLALGHMWSISFVSPSAKLLEHSSTLP